MKALSVLVLTLASSLSFGYGKVGDSATYNLKVQTQGKEFAGQSTNEVLSYNETTKKYALRTTTVVGEKPDVRDSEVTELFTPESAIKYVDGCATPLETVVVPAGTFQTCKLDQVDESKNVATVWIAKVPFGVAKLDYKGATDGTTVHMELVSFKDAQ